MSEQDSADPKDLALQIIENKPDAECKETFMNIFEKGKREKLEEYVYETNGESDKELNGYNVLHLAVSFNKQDTASAIIEKFHGLMFKKCKPSNKKCCKLTPFHIAVAISTNITKDMIKYVDESQDENLVRDLKDVMKNSHVISDLEGNVFMGQLPLHIAILSVIAKYGNKDTTREEDIDDCVDTLEVVKILLKQKANLGQTNHLGDTCFHSIMRFIVCFPLKEKAAQSGIRDLIALHRDKENNDMDNEDMNGDSYQDTEDINIDNNVELRDIIFTRNNDNATALQLATKNGHIKLFQYLLRERGLYYMKTILHDDIYEICRMDVTEMDKALLVQYTKNTPRKSNTENVNTQQSITELLCCLPLSTGIEMVTADIFEEIIERKWSKYIRCFCAAFFIHLVILAFLCVYAVAKARAIQGLNTVFSEDVLLATPFLSGLIAIVYFLQEVVFRCWIARQPMAMTAIHHNVVYRILTILFSIFLMGDVISNFIWANNCGLIISLMLGTWNLLFFLRACPSFSFYVVLINEALLKVLLPFAVLIVMQVFVYAAAMHATLLSPENANETITDFENYGKSFLHMGKLMLGLYEFTDLLNSTNDFMALLLFGVFVVFTFLLLINALIAVMTNRFSEVQDNRIMITVLQKLSILVFMDAFPIDRRAVLHKPGVKKDARYIISYPKVPSKDHEKPQRMIHKLRREFRGQRGLLVEVRNLMEKQEEMTIAIKKIEASLNYKQINSQVIHVHHYTG